MSEKDHINEFYQEYQVFSRRSPSSPIQEQFTLLAPNEEIALVMAQENFMRRETVVDIWVVKCSNIRKLTQEERASLQRLDNKDYRTAKGYGYLKKKWREKEQTFFDENEILSWAKGVSRHE
jgi:ring-1,2-phenylacetyl-CoA epoxidase subunit PaaB